LLKLCFKTVVENPMSNNLNRKAMRYKTLFNTMAAFFAAVLITSCGITRKHSTSDSVMFRINGSVIEDISGNALYHINGFNLEEPGGSTVYHITGGDITDTSGKILYRIKGNFIENPSGKTVYKIEGRNISLY